MTNFSEFKRKNKLITFRMDFIGFSLTGGGSEVTLVDSLILQYVPSP